MKTKKVTDKNKLKFKRFSIKPEPMYEPYRIGDDKILAESFEDLISTKGGTRGDWEDRFDALEIDFYPSELVPWVPSKTAQEKEIRIKP